VQQNGERFGRIGAAAQIDAESMKSLVTTVRYAPAAALAMAVERTWETSAFSLKMLGKMVIGQVSWKNLSGPVTIADYAGQSAQLGIGAYIAFLALISISLGVLNLLPIPLLDGDTCCTMSSRFSRAARFRSERWNWVSAWGSRCSSS